MPNIEIQGMDEEDLSLTHDQLVGLFRDAEYAPRLVITGVRSGVRDLNNKLQPFLRIYLAQGGVTTLLPDIKRRLQDFGLDIEVIMVHEFIPKKS